MAFFLNQILLICSISQFAFAAQFSAGQDIQKSVETVRKHADEAVKSIEKHNVIGNFRIGLDSNKQISVFKDLPVNTIDEKKNKIWSENCIYFTADMDVDCDGVDFKCKF